MATSEREWMIYGTTGYTGMLIAERAAEQGLRPVLAARDDVKLRAVAGRLGLPWRVFSLDDGRAVREGIAGMALVLHCAGPFSATSRPMLDACLAGHVHYLDLTGELEVFESCYARDSEANARGIVVMPGVGFDVVPTDCLARLLAQALPGATRLELGIAALGKISQGTAKTAIEGLPKGTLARRGGRITKIAPLVRDIDFAGRTRKAMATSWGDVASAYRTTGIPDITVYMTFPPAVITTARALRYALPVLGLVPVQRALRSLIERRVSPPTAEERAHGRSVVWGRVQDDDGHAVEGLLQCGEGYEFTITSSLAISAKVLSGAVPVGATTPARGLGGDFVRSLPDVTVTLLARDVKLLLDDARAIRSGEELDASRLAAYLHAIDWQAAGLGALGKPEGDVERQVRGWTQRWHGAKTGDDPRLLALPFGPTNAPGSLSRRELVARDAERTRRDTSNILYYFVFALFKTLVVLQQIYDRFERRLTTNERFATLGAAVGVLGDAAGRAIDRGTVGR